MVNARHRLVVQHRAVLHLREHHLGPTRRAPGSAAPRRAPAAPPAQAAAPPFPPAPAHPVVSGLHAVGDGALDESGGDARQHRAAAALGAADLQAAEAVLAGGELLGQRLGGGGGR